MRGVNSRCPANLLSVGKDRTRHLELSKLSRQRKQRRSFAGAASSLFHLMQSIAKREQRIEGNQALVVQHRANSPSQFQMHTLAIVALLMRAREQIDDLILRTPRIAICCKQDGSQRSTGCVEELRRRRNFGKRLNQLLPRRIQFAVRNLPLTGEYLPKPNVGLKSPQSVCAQNLVWHSANRVCHIDEAGHRGIAQIRKFGKDQIA